MRAEQKIYMRFNPFTGLPFLRSEEYFANDFRNLHGPRVWLYNPWTGEKRSDKEIGMDVTGLSIKPVVDEIVINLNTPQSFSESKPCCMEFFTCTNACVPRADYWKDKYHALILERIANGDK